MFVKMNNEIYNMNHVRNVYLDDRSINFCLIGGMTCDCKFDTTEKAEEAFKKIYENLEKVVDISQ